MLATLTIRNIQTLAAECDSGAGSEQFRGFLSKLLSMLADGLQVDVNAIKLLNDEILLSLYKFETIDALNRSLPSIADYCGSMSTYHPDWSLMAGRIMVLKLKLTAPDNVLDIINIDPQMWNTDYYEFCKNNAVELTNMINPLNDYNFYYFGIKTLEKSYLLKHLVTGSERIIETPQFMYLRIATSLWFPNLPMIKQYYDHMSNGLFTHASPTMFHAGLKQGTFSSCYLLSMQDDLDAIFSCLKNCAMISKSAGGIGLDITNIRHSKIGHLGQSSGIVPMLKVYDATMRYVDQAGRRKGSATISLQPWHIDFPDFIELKRQIGKEERRARDLFYSVWIPDLFMDRVHKNEMWTLFCPKLAPKLTETYGDEFDKVYLEYEEMYKQQNIIGIERVSAAKLWSELLATQTETGMPFISFKDTANETSNQKNLGIIRSLNLCQEIAEVTDSNTISSCNLASIALDEYVNNGKFNYEKLGAIVRQIVRGLNNVIDRTSYPLDTDTTKGCISVTNKKYRPLGIGVQALAETFAKLDLTWDSKEAEIVNRDIFATIYYYATDESRIMATELGAYSGFIGSPAHRGLLKPDLIARERARKMVRYSKKYANENLDDLTAKILAENLSPLYDWDALRKAVQRDGLYNSLLTALMPTASSAQIRYKNESFEPFTMNLYTRSVLAGTHIFINREMVADLQACGLWNNDTREYLMKHEGSLQYFTNYPQALHERVQFLKAKYRTSFEISQKLLLKLASDRAFYICQSQSFNYHIKAPTEKKLTELHMYGWRNGLTTGMYYLRSVPAVEAIKFTVSTEPKPAQICTDDVCISCQA